MDENSTFRKFFDEKIDHSIEIIRLSAQISHQYYNAPLIITYSGGKDSDVLADLAVKSGAEVEFINSHTTIDAPETVYHIRQKFSNLRKQGYRATIHMPKTTMWKLIEKKRLPPTRLIRYCCDELKESSNPNRYIATGIRKDESRQRSTRGEFEIIGVTKKKGQIFSYDHVKEVYGEAQEMDDVYDCKFITKAKQHSEIVCNPIFNWTETDIWNYIRKNGIKYNPLYDRGYNRIGCIGCPLGGRKNQLKEFADYPKYKQAYIRAFQRMIDKRKEDGLKTKWNTGEECFLWWVRDPNIPGQINLEDFVDGTSL